MHQKSVGIIGITGRMGGLLADVINNTTGYTLGLSFSRNKTGPNITNDLKKVFVHNDYVVDFSSAEIIQGILTESNLNPKPLILCTTGWNSTDLEKELILPLSLKAPVVITPNTSIGVSLQLYFATQIARILGHEYDIHISEKHHKNKKDSPSGTAKALAKYVGVDNAKISSERIGDIAGEHVISFTSEEEMIAIKHVAFSPTLFAKGVINILNWFELKSPKPGVYSMLDVLGLK